MWVRTFLQSIFGKNDLLRDKRRKNYVKEKNEREKRLRRARLRSNAIVGRIIKVMRRKKSLKSTNELKKCY